MSTLVHYVNFHDYLNNKCIFIGETYRRIRINLTDDESDVACREKIYSRPLVVKNSQDRSIDPERPDRSFIDITP